MEAAVNKRWSLLLCLTLVFHVLTGMDVGMAKAAADSTGIAEYAAHQSFPPAESDIVIKAADGILSEGAQPVLETIADVEQALIWSEGAVSWNFTVPADGLYELEIGYYALSKGTDDLKLAIAIDGSRPFAGLENVLLKRLWCNKGGETARVDGAGNEFAPEQEELSIWQYRHISDAEGLTAGFYRFALSAGEHSLTLSSPSGSIALHTLRFCPPEITEKYEDVLQQYTEKDYEHYTGSPIVIEGEKAQYKSSNMLVPLSDTMSAAVNPADPYAGKLNYIGGSNWSAPGDTLTWVVDVPRSGLYWLGFRFQQSYLINASVYRLLRIDGSIPFAQADSIAFDYCTDWKFHTLTVDDEPCFVYLEEGVHTLSLEVTLGALTDFSRTLKEVIYELGSLYREITMITGEKPDANRDYNLFGQIPDFEKRLTQVQASLKNLADEGERLSGKKGGTNAATLRNMAAVIERMLTYPYQAQSYRKSFYDNYSAVSSRLYEMTSMPLDIDQIWLVSPDTGFGDQSTGFFESLSFSVRRFFASFMADYNSVSDGGEFDTRLTLWVNRGRDQAQVLNHLVQSDFTPEKQIGVDIKLTNATVIQAILSGNGPDCYLQMSRTEPVNLAMRGALLDLTQFSDCGSVLERFMPGAQIPYCYGGGLYALPDTQTFYMMFYREDILDELGLGVPETWDEFIRTASVIMRSNMQVGLPYTQITDMNQINLGLGALNLFPTLLMQAGSSLYNDTLTEVELTSETAFQAFTQWTDFYTRYSYPKTYDFYNRFRVGLMPIAIQPYTQYSTLHAAASEIDGLWNVAPIPGTRQENGVIDRSQAGAGTGAVILKDTDHPEEAWEFLKWWTSADIQYRYSRNVESILGVTGRVATSNVEAFAQFSWGDRTMLETLKAQWAQVKEMPEVPGGYYVPRAVDQAFWNVVENNKTVREMLLEWDTVVDREMQEKRLQYGQ